MHQFTWLARKRRHGFTLVELAIVLIIVGLLVGSLMTSLSAQQGIANIKETERRLTQAQEALLGFAAAYGRLPCPAAPPPAGGAESPLNTGSCTNPLNGFLPASTLGLAPTDSQGYLLDAWGNPMRYSVYNATINSQSNPFTSPNGMKNATLEKLSSVSNLLYMCGGRDGDPDVNCGSESVLTINAVAAVYSTGPNGGYAASGEEAENTDADIVFVAKIASNFDDIVTWLSPNVLYNRMISAGRLP